MKINEEEMQEIIDDLQGTCKSLDEVLNDNGFEYDDLTEGNLEQLDSQIFNCSVCNWWCEIGELSPIIEDECVCRDCEEDY